MPKISLTNVVSTLNIIAYYTTIYLLQLLLQEIGRLQDRMQVHHDKHAVHDTPSLPRCTTLLPLLTYTDADTYLTLTC